MYLDQPYRLFARACKRQLLVSREALADPFEDATAPIQVVAELWSFQKGELQVEPKMANHIKVHATKLRQLYYTTPLYATQH